MKQPLDRITEAYYSGMGDKFGIKVRERIHWICAQAKGEKILDVGCSQGITTILLAREAKQVLGIDLIEESIEYAKKQLANESETTQKHATFKVANFMDDALEEEKYDAIILSEVLEHLTDPERFLKKASERLTEDGQVIITVPFGINDYFDHKKTYYLVDIINEIEKNLFIDKIKYFGKWIGIVAKQTGTKLEIDKKEILNLEKSFYELENNLLNEVSTYKNNYNAIKSTLDKKEQQISDIITNLKNKEDKIITLKSKMREIEKELEIEKQKNEEFNKKIAAEYQKYAEIKETNDKQIIENKELKKKIAIEHQQYIAIRETNDNLVAENEELKKQLGVERQKHNTTREKNEKLIAQTEEIKKRLAVEQQAHMVTKKINEQNKRENSQLNNKINDINRELLAHISSEEKALKSYKSLLGNYEKLQKKYKILKQSKLGKLTLWYWKFKKKYN